MMQATMDILLVDDDEVDREAVRRRLASHFSAREATTLGQAAALLSTQPPVCVLLDYHLPDGDGLQLLPLLAQMGIPVIILTGEESPEIIVQAMQAGVQDYLVKSHLTRLSLEHAIRGAIEKMALKRDMEEKNRQLRELASALTLAEQRERRRISQILHDDVQQLLYGIQMHSQLIVMDALPDSPVQEQVSGLRKLVNAAILATRTLAVELSPPLLQDEGLATAFGWLANHMAERHNLQVDLALQTDSDGLSADVCVLLFQLVRELLFNVVKHAGIQQAELVFVEKGDNLCISVIDRGCGFEQAPVEQRKGGGFGLYSARERLALFGGELEIETAPGHGVSATIVLPRAHGPAA